MNVKTQDDRFDIIFIIGSTLYHKNFDLRNGKYIGIECLDENFIYFSQWKNKIMLPD